MTLPSPYALAVPQEKENSEFHHWDSRVYPPKEAFARLQERLSAWRPTLKSDRGPWHALVEGRNVAGGAVYQSQLFGVDLERGRREIAQSKPDYFLGFFVLSGSGAIIRDDRTRVLKPGDLAVFDASYPITVQSDAAWELISFRLQKGTRPRIDRHRDSFRDLVVERGRVSPPLLSCLYFLGDRLRNDDEEVNAVFEAIVNLLLIDAGGRRCETGGRGGHDKAIYRDILLFSEKNLDDPTLSVTSVARAFGISERHVYRLFAGHGHRFSAHLRKRRLQAAAAELVSNRYAHITDVAVKWGFSELSTFSRAFKKRFGCTPREFQRGS